jgi:adenosylcobinamide kinase/adenosylcobinamide-phosphate guanylyltransferase
MEMPKKNITLVLGGARSGKSHYAQQIASHFERVTFIATGRSSDVEMRRKIAQHRRERPRAWKTVEAPFDLHKAIRSESQKADLILIDCLTVYVANVIDARRKSKSSPEKHVEAVCDAIRTSRTSIVVVSNEVGSGVVPPYRSGRIYRDALGQMNQRIAQIADRVVLMFAGLPLTLKDVNAGHGTHDVRLAHPAKDEWMESTNGMSSAALK